MPIGLGHSGQTDFGTNCLKGDVVLELTQAAIGVEMGLTRCATSVQGLGTTCQFFRQPFQGLGTAERQVGIPNRL